MVDVCMPGGCLYAQGIFACSYLGTAGWLLSFCGYNRRLWVHFGPERTSESTLLSALLVATLPGEKLATDTKPSTVTVFEADPLLPSADRPVLRNCVGALPSFPTALVVVDTRCGTSFVRP